MIGICPYTGKTLTGLSQLIMRIDRLTRTVKGARPKLRGYGSEIREHLGKNNSRIIITAIQNNLLTEISRETNGLTDFKVEQVKLMPEGKLFFIGVYQGERTEFNI